MACLAPTAAFAQGADFQRSYIEPFPRGDRYRVLVLGDSLGDGIWAGLYRVFKEDGNIDVIKRSKVSTGMAAASMANSAAHLAVSRSIFIPRSDLTAGHGHAHRTGA